MAEAILNQPHFQDADKAREHLEALRWPHGPVCPHCGSVRAPLALEGKSYRPGLFKCKDCYEQFTVTVGTVFERSKIALNVWLQAVHLMCASKKGISAKQLERMLGVSYKTAWFMSHRIREAMTGDNSTMLGGPGSSGVVEADETFWGTATTESGEKKTARGGFRHKMMVVSLVERDGNKRSFHIPTVNGKTLGAVLQSQISEKARLVTDEARWYKAIGKTFAQHESVSHGRGEYARGDVTTNTVEASFAILKRGLIGTFHSVSEKHLQRYCNEFDFRWNTRQSQGFSDTDRTTAALKGITGKRLTYRRIGGKQQATDV
ncbi:MAG: IS1595 family transposase [Hydrogenophaga sp.]|jgi:transposase-like protein|uniref:IS1595 family transposase n=1 Tax=Hydrogenophaga sp. TaxID=1904254 RepID=UPI001DE7402F|nr:IS1595 family transposase [Hydrogenophaga sp.]MBW0170120.1 IS1595 family transposase [Hydrogenophaga sp.]MBW0182697.1 IS1595 family transposase [Hydrogenophaga sp.]